jgi:foldase protein PrsA
MDNKTGQFPRQMNFYFSRTLGRNLSGMALLALPVFFAGCTGGGGDGMASSAGNTSQAIATVDGATITRADLQAYAEAVNGHQLLPQLIDYELIMKELKNKGLDVSEAELLAAIEKQRQGMGAQEAKQFGEMLQLAAPQAEAIRRQVKRRLAIDKIITKDIKVNEADVKKWFDKNKATRYPLRANVGMLISSQKARADAMERQLSGKTKTFKLLVDEQKKTKDPMAQSSTEESPQMTVSTDVPPPIRSAIEKTKAGETSKVVTLTAGPGQPPVYAILRIVEKKDSSYEALKPQIEMDYKLEQVARQEFKKTAAPNMKFEDAIKQIRQNLGQQAMQMAMQNGQMTPPPTDADAISALTREGERKLLEDLRKSGKVQISDATYAQLNDIYKAAPASISPVTPPGATTGAPPTGASKAPAQ